MNTLLSGKKDANPILRSSILIGLIMMGVKVLGYAEKLILAYYFGTDYRVDVYNIVSAFILSVFVFFREVIEPGFLGSFLKAIRDQDRKEAWTLFAFFTRYILTFTVLLSIVVYCAPFSVIHALAPGLSRETSMLAGKMIQFAFPATIFLSLSSLTNISLNGLKEFALPAMTELLFRGAILLTMLIFCRHWGIYAMIAGLLIGSFIKLSVQGWILIKKFPLHRIAGRSAYFKDTWKLTWPLLIGVSFSQLSSLIDNGFASYLQEGAISALSYARKIVELPILVFPYILSTVVFPYFSELAVARQKQQLGTLFSGCLSSITLVFVPLSVFFVANSHEIVSITFERGAFNSQSTLLTAGALTYYAAGMLFFAIETVLVIFYFSNMDTRTPIFVGIAGVVLNIILTYVLIGVMGYAGVALALALSKMIKVLVLLFFLRYKLTINYQAVRTLLVKVFFSATLTAIVLFVARHLMQTPPGHSLLKKALTLSIYFLLAITTYIAGLRMMKIKLSLPRTKLEL